MIINIVSSPFNPPCPCLMQESSMLGTRSPRLSRIVFVESYRFAKGNDGNNNRKEYIRQFVTLRLYGR